LRKGSLDSSYLDYFFFLPGPFKDGRRKNKNHFNVKISCIVEFLDICRTNIKEGIEYTVKEFRPREKKAWNVLFGEFSFRI
jgi:hypothetical protein